MAEKCHADREIAYRPARVLMQDLPAYLPLLIWRQCAKVKRLGGDTAKVNPLTGRLVIDHSVTVDRFGDDEAFEENVR